MWVFMDFFKSHWYSDTAYGLMSSSFVQDIAQLVQG